MDLNAKELRNQSVEELLKTKAQLQQDLFQSRMKQSVNQLENTMVIRKSRRDIARINTLLAEKGVHGSSHATGTIKE